jgi:hypothetical protein
MQADLNRMSLRTQEEVRNARLARGLRAVAATVIIGGIVMAAFETTVPERPASPAVLPVLGTSTTSDPAGITVPSSDREPLLDRIDRTMEQHG